MTFPALVSLFQLSRPSLYNGGAEAQSRLLIRAPLYLRVLVYRNEVGERQARTSTLDHDH
ncbi:MAG: hypothetical protein JRM71_01050 [Nitrososphaerota archaeon]|nr:hypothetical protein [Nitrososphaerota archaeon]